MPLLLALHAMATRFELVLHGDDPVRLRAAGEEALVEIERLERLLSFYRSDSEITAINRRAFGEPVRVSGEVFRLLRGCAEVFAASAGAFDVTIGPLMRAWKLAGGAGAVPDAATLAAARAVTGFAHVELDERAQTVRFARDGVAIDLGAAGKGFAVDAAIGVLQELGVTSALLHGGTSSVHALGAPPGEDGWRVALEGPKGSGEQGPEGSRAQGPKGPRAQGPKGSRAQGPKGARAQGLKGSRAQGPKGARAQGREGSGARGFEEPWTHAQLRDRRVVVLRDAALSVSAAHGKAFEQEGRQYGHVIDPRTGHPVSHTRAAGVTGPSSFLCDALSTALMVNGAEWLPTLRERWADYDGWTA
jgi:thiamine biosynthesis lipoprotein ApbE